MSKTLLRILTLSTTFSPSSLPPALSSSCYGPTYHAYFLPTYVLCYAVVLKFLPVYRVCMLIN